MLSLDTSYQTVTDKQGRLFFVESYDGIEFTVFEHESRVRLGALSTISAEELTQEVDRLIEGYTAR